MDVELVVDAHAEVGEGPIWRASTGTLLWVDILGSTLHEFDPSTGRDAVTDVGQPVGTVVPRRSGGVVLALADGFVAMSDDGAFTRLADVEAENPAVRMNDGKCDSRGRLWAGTMPFDEERPIGALWCLEADHSLRRILGGTKVSNGIVWSHDDTLMYYIDSLTHRIDLFDFDADAGTVANRRVFFEWPPERGIPDGMTIDADGCLWVGFFGGWAVRRITPDGEIDAEIDLPVSNVTACWFGGDDLGDLYITSAKHHLPAEALAQQPHAGGLFRARPGAVGVPAYEFGG